MSKNGHNRNTNKQQGWNVKESVLRPDRNKKSRVDLDLSEFNNLLKTKGVRVKVFRSGFCPKVKSVDSAEHEFDCTMCNGSGMIDLYPIETLAFLQSQDLEEMQHVEGMVDGNHVAMTFEIGIELQYFTKIELLDFTDIFNERIRRKEGTSIDILRYEAKRVNFLVDYDGQKYYQGRDFNLNSEGNVEWESSATIADGTIYSIHYEANVQFRAVRAMHVNRFTQVNIGKQVEHVKLPEQWLVSKEFLVRRTDINGNEMKQGPYDNHEIVED